LFRHLRLSTRLIAGFGIVLMLLVALAWISIARVNTVNANLETINDLNSVKQRYAINFRGSVHDRAIALRDMILLSSPDELATTLDHIKQLTDKYADSAGPLDAMLVPEKQPSADELRILASIKETEGKTMPVIAEVLQLKARGDQTGAHALLLSKARPLFVEWLARINQFIDLEEANNKTVAASTREATSGFQHLLLTLCGIALAIGAAVAWWAIASVRPIGTMAQIMGRLGEGEGHIDIPAAGSRNELGQLADAMLSFRTQLKTQEAATRDAERSVQRQTDLIVSSVGEGLASLSHGDLTARVTADLTGPFGKLKDDFNGAMDSLTGLIGAVSESAQTIHTGSTEIASASEDLARRTEGTAASLEQTVASIAQIDARLKASAEAAGRTVERADQAIATVGEGRAVADDAVQAMSRVSESAKGIDSVIEGLDKIAFQTRVLAMNAAVEAGRAGEAGRGFAVVADLVGALAMRSEEEAKRAREQLTATQTDVAMAMQAVGKVDGALSDISGDVGQVHGLLATMAEDNRTQSKAISEITGAINEMDRSTQQNAAMVEETSAAARNLTSEVSVLEESARAFRIDTGRRAKGAVRAVRPVSAGSALASADLALAY
jgi:methyl-accepting chemotaxis protein